MKAWIESVENRPVGGLESEAAAATAGATSTATTPAGTLTPAAAGTPALSGTAGLSTHLAHHALHKLHHHTHHSHHGVSATGSTETASPARAESASRSECCLRSTGINIDVHSCYTLLVVFVDSV